MKPKTIYIFIVIIVVFNSINSAKMFTNPQKINNMNEQSKNTLHVQSIKNSIDPSIYIYSAATFEIYSDSGEGTAEDPYIIANKIINASIDISGFGINIQNTELYFILENNTISNAKDLAAAVFLYNVTNGIIRNNTFYDNIGSGITCRESSSIIISNNTIYNTEKRGLYLYQSNEIEIYDNWVYTNNIGSYVVNSQNNIFQDNIFSHNELHGIYLHEANNNFVTQNELQNNDGCGLFLYGSSYNVLEYNTICYNQQSGVYLGESSTSNTLHKNDIEFNLDIGIYLTTSSTNVFTNNSLVSNTIGFGIYGSDNNRLFFNRVQTCSQTGYIFTSSNNNTLESNIAYQNGKYGVMIEADYNTLKSNIIRENTQYGIVLMDTSNNITVRNNNFLFNNLGEISQACDNGTDNIFEFNYWQDHSGNDTNEDGYFDTHYPVAGTSNTNDIYPITENPFRPSAPLQLQVWSASNYAFLNWSTSENTGGYVVTNYNIYRSTVCGINYTLIATVENTKHKYHDFTLINGLTYYYVVRAENIAGESTNSAEVIAQPATVPSPPQNVTAWEVTDCIKISWSVSLSTGGSEITNYRIYRSTTSMSNYILVGTVSDSTFIYNDTSIERGVTYYYVVRAVNSVGESLDSNEIQITLELIVSSSSSTGHTSSESQSTTSTFSSSSQQSSNQDNSSESQSTTNYNLIHSLLGIMTFSVIIIFFRHRKNH